jgi:hypothetical protein
VSHPLLPGAPWDVRDTTSRDERFWELARAGYAIPECGTFSNLSRLNVPLVVYDDPYAHCGEGKRLWKPGDVGARSSQFCSRFIDTHERPKSSRVLRIGHFEFHLEYTSDDEWRSNVGDVTCTLLRHFDVSREYDLIRYPMYAVDTVHDPLHERNVAVDLNVCPGLPMDVINAVGRETLRESLRSFKP